MKTRRDFLSVAGKTLGLAAFTTPTIGALLKDVEAATRTLLDVVTATSSAPHR